MNKKIAVITAIIVSFIIGFLFNNIGIKDTAVSIIENSEETDTTQDIKPIMMKESNMKLGAFSVSLSVKDLAISKEFYEKMGFTVNGGGMEMNYLIMKNENALIGLFQGMFEGNILTFNPGWNENAEDIESFDDVRGIQSSLKKDGITLMTEAPDTTVGPASIMLTDPDGNLILIDQHR